MFVRMSSPSKAICLESIVSLEVTGSGSSSVLTATLTDGSTKGISGYTSTADAQAAFDVLIEKLGWTTIPGSVVS